MEGIVNGDISAASITVGARATVIGSLKAEKIDIAGTVHGTVEAHSLSLVRSARVHGEILSQARSIEAGAVLDEQVAEPT